MMHGKKFTHAFLFGLVYIFIYFFCVLFVSRVRMVKRGEILLP
jgi:hypothetical protein